MNSVHSFTDNLSRSAGQAPNTRKNAALDDLHDARASSRKFGGVHPRTSLPSLQSAPEDFQDEVAVTTGGSELNGGSTGSTSHRTSATFAPSATCSSTPEISHNIENNVKNDSEPSSSTTSSSLRSLLDDSISSNAGSPCVPKQTSSKDSEVRSSAEPYHMFTERTRWCVVVTIGMAGLFSGLSSNIYFPSLNAIAKDLNVSLESVSLTITSYLIVQGISPLMWGTLSDSLGRRPIYIASFAIYIAANMVLSFSPNFAVLLVFRGLQAAGSASTVSIGNGVIQDIAAASERGAFISFYQAIRNFSIAIGPLLGGALAEYFGFRSIFIFLLILSSLVLAVIVTFLPETTRRITGNGSVRVHGIYKPLIYSIKGEPSYTKEPEEPTSRNKITIRTFLEPLKILARKDVLLNLIFSGVIYSMWSMVTSSTTNLFKQASGLNELFIGLAFLPNGLGTIAGSALAGKLMTRDYDNTETEYKAMKNLPDDCKLTPKIVPADFPIEKARLRHVPWIAGIFVAAVGVYGFTFANPNLVSRSGWIAVPLFLQFIIAATSNSVFAINQTLVSDLCPGQGASASAVINLVRCSLGAGGVAAVEIMLERLGPGVTYLAMALVVVVVTPLVAVNMMWGMGWRGKRMALKQEKESEKRHSMA